MLGAGPLQVPAIKKAEDLGFFIICVDHDPDAVGFELADQAEVVSTLDVEAVLALAEKEAVKYVITSTSDAPVRTAALVSERLGLPTGISYVDALCATHKDAMRDRLAESGVPVPEFRACGTFEEFFDALAHFGYDCIVKPADSAASRGVVKLDPSSEVDLQELFDREMGFSRKGTLMVEQCVRGAEVSVEGMTVGGETSILSITDKMVTEPPYFVELGHSEPSLLPDATKTRVTEVARDAIAAVGIVDGPSHTEIMVTESGPVVIEIAARLGGDFITSKLVPLSTGVDMVGASVALALGLPVDVRPSRSCGSAIRFIVSDTGTISSIEVDPALYGLAGFEEVELYKKPGDAISAPRSSNDRVGHVVCTGADAEAARRAVEEALSMIKVELF